MKQTELLQAILSKLSRGDAPDSQYPDAKGEYWALCPYHQDEHATNFSVSDERGFKCFVCPAKGSLRDLGEKLGVSVDVLTLYSRGYRHPPPPLSLTLEEYAKAKALPVDFLKTLGLSNTKYLNTPAVRMSYLDQNAAEVAVRFRRTLSKGEKDERFKWRKGDKVVAYGLWKLKEARETLILVEGESDAQTLWFHGLPALGIPGATNWKPAWADLLRGLTVYVWQEPDVGGETFVTKIAESLPGVRIITPPQGRKDVSECHILGDAVPEVLRKLMFEARSWQEMRQEAQDAEAAQAETDAAALLHCPDILGEFAKVCNAWGLVGEDKTAKLLYLALSTRVLKKPTSVSVKGPSAGGKSFTVETVLKAFPESAYLDFTSMSEHALVYDDRPIEHRFIILYEAEGLGNEKPGETNTLAYIVRSLLSEGVIKYTTVERTAEGLQPRTIERHGPTGLIVTTTRVKLHAENETRLLSVTVRDDPAQTQAIFQALAERANGQAPAEPDLKPWQALQRWLQLTEHREVTIPYAHQLADEANSGAVRMRRDFGVVLNLIRAHAILHQMQRGHDARGRIVASLVDYQAVYNLVLELVNEGIEATVSKTVRETVDAVTALRGDEMKPVTVTQVARQLKIDKAAASRRVWVAREHGYLNNTEDKKGKPAQLVVGDPLPNEVPALPTPNKVEELLTLLIKPYDGQESASEQPEEEGGGVYTPPCTVSTHQQSVEAPPAIAGDKPDHPCRVGASHRTWWRCKGQREWKCNICHPTTSPHVEKYTVPEAVNE